MTITIPAWAGWVAFGVACYLAGLLTLPACIYIEDWWFRRRARKAGLNL